MSVKEAKRFAVKMYIWNKNYFGIFDLQKSLWVAGWSWGNADHASALKRIQEIHDGQYDPDQLVLCADNPYGPEVFRPWDEEFDYDDEDDVDDDVGY